MQECSQHIQNIADFLDGDIDRSLCTELEKHLKECKNCRIMVDSLKQTVILCREGKKERLPVELESKLNNALKKRWQKKFGDKRI